MLRLTVAVASSLSALLVGSPVSAPLRSTDPPVATVAPLPADWDASKYLTAQLNDVACARNSGLCFAVGPGVIEELTQGRWIPLDPPVPSRAGSSPYPILTAVSCGAPDSCAAVGSLAYSGQPVLETWNGVTWTASSPRLPKDAAADQTQPILVAVSCAGHSRCVAAGSYLTRSKRGRPLLMSGRRGHWRVRPQGVPAAAIDGELFAVSCRGAHFCQAVGDSNTADGGQRPLVVSHVGRAWTETEPDLPSNVRTSLVTGILMDVSCSSGVTCTALGIYYAKPGSRSTGLVESLRRGRWRPAAVRSADHSRPQLVLSKVSCPSPRRCLAVGSAAKGGGRPVPVVARILGRRASAVEVSDPTTGALTPGVLTDVACASRSRCEAIGTTSDTGQSLLVSVGPDVVAASFAPAPPMTDEPGIFAVAASSRTTAVAVGTVAVFQPPGFQGLLETGISLVP